MSKEEKKAITKLLLKLGRSPIICSSVSCEYEDDSRVCLCPEVYEKCNSELILVIAHLSCPFYSKRR